MTRIKVEPNQLHALSRELQHVSQELRGLEGRLGGAIGGLDWEARRRADIDGRAGNARSRVRVLSDQAENLSRFLAMRASAFEETDRQGVEGLSAVIDMYPIPVPRGYLNLDNIGSTSQARISDLKEILSQSSSGRHVAEWLDRQGVSIEFGDTPHPKMVAKWDLKRITINKDYAHLSDLALAAVLLHEGQHSRSSNPLDVPIIGPIFNEWYKLPYHVKYLAYPFPEEYQAYRAEAEFWREVRDNAPPETFLDDVVNLIFKPDGEYLDRIAVYRDLHNRYHVTGVFNP